MRVHSKPCIDGRWFLIVQTAFCLFVCLIYDADAAESYRMTSSCILVEGDKVGVSLCRAALKAV